MTNFADLKGKTLCNIDLRRAAYAGNDVVIFSESDGTKYYMYHSQECCERVDLDEVIGDLEDLLNTEITIAEERCSKDGRLEVCEMKYNDESYTWTFYELRTIKGSVTLRWYGGSNGYYSEGVDFFRAGEGSYNDE